MIALDEATDEVALLLRLPDEALRAVVAQRHERTQHFLEVGTRDRAQPRLRVEHGADPVDQPPGLLGEEVAGVGKVERRPQRRLGKAEVGERTRQLPDLAQRDLRQQLFPGLGPRGFGTELSGDEAFPRFLPPEPFRVLALVDGEAGIDARLDGVVAQQLVAEAVDRHDVARSRRSIAWSARSAI